jgi:hypothetical protein
MKLIESLRAWYAEAIDNTSSPDGLEPEYECNYCHHRDVGPTHADECIAVDCALAADEIEGLIAIRKAARLVYGATNQESAQRHIRRLGHKLMEYDNQRET